jgi:spore coat protein U-like protein
MKKRLAVALIAMLLGAGPAVAGSDPEDFTVEVSVVPSCTITAALDIQFLPLDVYGFGNQLAQGKIIVLCTKSGSYSIELDAGVNPDLNGGRQMSDGGLSAIPYWLYQDAGTTQEWKTGVDALTFVGTGYREEKTVYAVLTWTEDMLPFAPVGSYSDLVTATVNF